MVPQIAGFVLFYGSPEVAEALVQAHVDLHSHIVALSLFPLLSMIGAWRSRMGAHGWVVGIANHGSSTRSKRCIWLASSGSP